MALADDKGTGLGFFGWAGMEAMEPRRLMAVVPIGQAVIGNGVIAVESAAANTDTTNNFRYAVYETGAGTAQIAPITGGAGVIPGTPLNIPNPTGGTISNLDVAANTPGDAVAVTYEITTTTGGGNGIPTTINSDVYTALFVNGNLVGGAVRANSNTIGNQTDCRIAMDGSGNFIVVWQSNVNGQALVGRRFNADGSTDGNEFIINTTGVEPDVAANAAGNFLIVYNVATGNAGTFAQLYNANGTANGTPLQINAATFSEPTVALANNGRFVVAWAAGAGAERTVLAQQFTAAGAPNGNAFNVSLDQTLAQTAPEIGIDTAGGFVIGYAQASTGVVYDSLGFRLFRANGNPADVEAVINGVQFGADNRFGLAYRVPGLIHVAYADTTGQAIQVTYQDDSNTGNNGGETPPPAGSLVIDGSTQSSAIIRVTQTNTEFVVSINGTVTNYLRATYSSLYILGSSGNDLIVIDNPITAPTIVYARVGSDTVYGGSGNDQIDGGDGGTVTTTDPETGLITTAEVGNAIQARAGDDYVYGGSSDDTVFGGGGNDRLLGGPGRNVIYGETGEDTCLGGSRGDGIIGGPGNDVLYGNDGGDYLDGAAGNDTLFGGEGFDRLNGSNGNDALFGDAGSDILHGGRGSDSVYGGDGRDTLFGDAGADLLRGGGVNGIFGPGGGGVFGQNQLDIVYYDLLDLIQGESTRLLVR